LRQRSRNVTLSDLAGHGKGTDLHIDFTLSHVVKEEGLEHERRL